MKIVSRQYEVEIEEGLLALTEIESSSKYESERKTSTGFILSLYMSELQRVNFILFIFDFQT